VAARHKLVLSLLVVVAVGLIAGSTTWSAFTSSTDNSNNSFSSGTVVLGDNDVDSAVLSLSNAKRGNSASGCIKVTYSGSLPARVRMWATTTGTLASYLDIRVRRGSTPSSFPTCAPFTDDGTNHIGQGNGVIYNGALSSFPTSGSPLTDPTAGSPETWTNGEERHYEITVTLPSGAGGGGQGVSSTLNLFWEAQPE
jgi:predicted ribosomally synthesized peptide with SipW-like signal peptide